MMIWFVLTSFFVFGEVHDHHWDHIHEVSDRHEFLKSNETVTQPQDTWQTLFSLVYLDQNVQKVKDCIFFKVPGKDPGILKIKSIAYDQLCDTYLLNHGDKEFKGIKTLQFSASEEEVKISYSTMDFKSKNLTALLQKKDSPIITTMHLSSAEYKHPKVLFLASKLIQGDPSKQSFKKDHEICHNIDEDCSEVSPSDCSDCERGWYEVPNGCPKGPKYCGIQICGVRNAPACRRGMKWQRKESVFDCQSDSSFAYCSKGLSIQCEGRKAFCR
jgi:hypothetical protein